MRTHVATLDVPAFHIDVTPVTKSAYSAWLQTSGWRPNTTQNWLADWDWQQRGQNASAPPRVRPGTEKQPVVWVSREDAKAYCAAKGARLPHSVEWQLAAQGPERLAWPWGNTFDASKVPPLNSSRDMPPLADVDAFPEAKSPYGLLDLVGNVYQWSDRFDDDHTAKAVLRGASAYKPEPMRWDAGCGCERHSFAPCPVTLLQKGVLSVC